MIKANHFQIEITNRCNLACIECPHRLMERKWENMSDEVFNRIMEIITPLDPQTVIVHKDGEPLLHPRFDFIFSDVCKTLPKTKIDIYTNAYFLKPELFEKLGESTVKNKVWFLVTMHGHKYNGTPYDLKKPTENVLACMDIVKARGWHNMEFIVVSHKTDSVNQEDMEDFRDFWMFEKEKNRALKDVHVNVSINPWGQLIKMKEGMAHYDSCPYCDSAHYFIGVTGNVLPCCVDLEEQIVFGNIMTDDMEVVERRRQDFYEIMVENKERMFEVCQRCLS